MLRRHSCCLIVTALVLVGSERAQGWGDRGHQAVARIAARYVNAETKLRLRELLALDLCGKLEALEDQLGCVASWPDPPVKDQRPYTANWHFVDIPLRSTKEKPTAYSTVALSVEDHCVMDPERGDCAILAVARLQSVLGNPVEAPITRLEALKFVVHIIGDIHQPLHCVTHQVGTTDHLGDLGGNRKIVQWLGKDLNPRWNGQWNLHSVWDEGIIDKRVAELGSEEKYFSFLTTRAADLQKDQPALNSGSDPNWKSVPGWVTQGYDLAAKVAYANLPPFDSAYKYKTKSGDERTGGYRLTADYYAKAAPVVDLQLMKGGLRLAGYLERAFRVSGSDERQ
jgi:hypothetical protein